VLLSELSNLVCRQYRFLAQAEHFYAKALRQCAGNRVYRGGARK
jgi:hypothetical protein